jgi:hypothetical protein
MANKANQVVDSNVVVQIVEAPKAEYVLQIADAQHLDKSVELLSDGEALMGDGKSKVIDGALILGKVLMPVATVKPTFAQYGVVRQVWLRKYVAFNPHASEESAQKAFERCFNEAKRQMPELERPKSPQKASVVMSEKRAKIKAELEAMLDSQLSERLATYKANDNFTEANKVKAEIKRREKEANAGIEEEVKSAREVVIKQIKLCSDIELLNEISQMLPSLPIAKM